MTQDKPNVVPGEAAMVARDFVFENRSAEEIDPAEVVARMLAEGHGTEFPLSVRRKRLRTWALQVFRRLKKHGWLEKTSDGGWEPTENLNDCRDSRSLAKQARRRKQGDALARPPASPSVPSTPTELNSWEGLVQAWVFNHRRDEFGVAEVAVAVVQHGFGQGDIGQRLEAARVVVESELAALQKDGLLRRDDQTGTWHPTELLRTWPQG